MFSCVIIDLEVGGVGVNETSDELLDEALTIKDLLWTVLAVHCRCEIFVDNEQERRPGRERIIVIEKKQKEVPVITKIEMIAEDVDHNGIKFFERSRN